MNNLFAHLWQNCLLAVDEISTRSSLALSRSNPPSNPLQMDGLEPRVLFSAVPVDLAMILPEQAVQLESVDSVESAAEFHSESESSLIESTPREIVVIDSGVENLEQQLEDLAGRNVETFVLDSDRDGIDQISEILDEYSDLRALHLVSHGSEGELQLGSTTLSNATLEHYAGRIASWGSAFAADADLMLYGCDVAGSSKGQEFVESLRLLTGADVAASSDATGHVNLGADWEFEYTTGQIQSEVVFSAEMISSWEFSLATNAESLFLHTDGSSGSEDPTIEATETPPVATLGQFDGNGGLGKKLSKDSGGFNQSDATKYQLWYGAPGGYSNGFSLDGNVSFDLHARSMSAGDDGYIRAFLAVTDASGNILRNITPTGGPYVASVTSTSFVNYSFNFGSITDEFIAADERLAVKIVNEAPTSEADIEIAYGVTDLPATTLDFFARDPLVVTNTTDTAAPGSLRWAIDTANADAGTDRIVFDIAGGGPHVITPGAAYNTITETVIIDGTTDPDQIVIDGSGTSGANGFTLNGSASGSTIRGLVINGFDDAGIRLDGSDNNVIEGNYFGTDATGTVAVGMTNGVYLDNSDNNLIGGDSVAARNVFAGSSLSGVVIKNGSDFNQVQGNYIGTNASGTAALSNFNGVFVENSSNNTIGGSTSGKRNIISGNNDEGIEISGNSSNANVIQGNFVGTNFDGTSVIGNNGEGIMVEDAPNTVIGGEISSEFNVIGGSQGIGGTNRGVGILVYGNSSTGTVIQGNYIGTDQSGSLDLGNTSHGILFSDTGEGGTLGATSDSLVGGLSANNRNVIANNDGSGISVDANGGGDHQFLGNSIFDNAILGIDLLENNVAEAPAGPGFDDNAPLLTGPVISSATGNLIFIFGTLNGQASTDYRIEFFRADGPGGQGEEFLGFMNVTTGAVGGVNFSMPVFDSFAEGDYITATSTETATGTTSEFSGNVEIDFKPGFTSLGGTRAFIEDGGAVQVDSSVSVNDIDATHFQGGSLVVDIDDTNGTANDRLAIRDEGSGPGNIHLVGSDIHYNGSGTAFASFSGGTSDTDPLVISFNNTLATEAAVERLIENITFENVSDTPFTGDRTIEFVLTDSDGNASDTGSVTMNVQKANDAPTGDVTISGTPTEDQLLTVSNTLADVDGMIGATVTYQWKRDGLNIGGETNNSYTLVDADVGKTITVEASYTDDEGFANTKTSAGVGPVVNINDAPVLNNGATMNLSMISWLSTDNDGDTVDSILASVGDPLTDADTSALEGIAVTGIDNTNGTWQFSTDFTTSRTWTPFATDVSDTKAVLLAAGDPDTRIRFIANANYTGTALISFRGWDQTTGTPGQVDVNLPGNGGTFAFSANTAVAQVTVANPFYADNFDAVSYSGNDGSLAWTNDWQEIGEANGAATGDVRVANEVGDAALELFLDPDNSAWREADLSMAGTATLTFDYKRENFEGFDSFIVYVQTGGSSGATVITGAPGNWEELARFDGPGTDPTFQNANIDLSAHLAADTRILFLSDSNGNDNVYIDNVRIDLALPSADPVVTLPGSSLGYTEDDPATIIDSGASVTDGDSVNFNGGSLVVDFLSGGTANDRLAIFNEGVLPTEIGVSGSDVTYGGVIIGSFSGGVGLTPLSISFNTQADATSVTKLLQNITYENVSDNPSITSRSVRFVVSDGAGGTSADVTQTVTMTAQNDLVDIGGFGDSSIDDDTTVQPFSTVTIDDKDVDNVNVSILLAGGDDNGQFTAASLLASGFNKGGAGSYSYNGISSAVAQAAIRQLVFQPTVNQVAAGGTVITNMTVSVNDGIAAVFDNSTDVTVTSVNDAPTISGGVLASIMEDNFNPPGAAVSALVGGSFSDPDTGSSFGGVVVVGNGANPVTEGAWQYSSNGGTNWFDIGTVDDSGSGLAVSATSLIRFVPVSGFNGTPTSLTIRGLDDTHGGGYSTTAGAEVRQTIDTSTPLATSPFATSTVVIGTSVTPTPNTPPSIGGTGDSAINDDTTVSPFSSVTISDVDGDNVVTTVTLSGGDTNGAFTSASLLASGFSKTGVGQYTLASTTTANAQSAIRMLVFDPTDNQVAPSGTVMTTFSIDVNDGATSTVNFQTDVTVTSVNDAPTISGGVLASIMEDNFNPPGAAVSVLVGGSFSDPDTGSSFGGVVVVGNGANPVTEGAWQYSSNGGTNWFDIGTVDDSGSGLAVSATSLIRFVPVSGFNGTPTSLTIRGLDDTHGGGYSTTAGVEIRQTTDTSTPLATSPFATSTVVIGTSVTPTPNTPPSIGGTGDSAINDDTTVSPFSSVTISDVDGDNVVTTVTLSGGDTNGAFTSASLLASGFSKTGVGQYTLASTTTGNAQSAIRALEFDPTDNQVAPAGTVMTTFSIDVNDGATSTVNFQTDVTVTSVNDAPTISGGVLASIMEDNFNPPGAAVSALVGGSFSDPDTGSSFGGVVVVGNGANPVTEGAWQYSSNGGTNWFDIGTVDDSGSGLAVSATSLIRFVPVSGFNGTPTSLTIRGLDDTHVGGYSTTAGVEVRQTTDTSTPLATSAFSTSTVAIGTSVSPAANTPSSIGGTGDSAINDNTTVSPFSSVTISDVDGDNVVTTVTLSGGDTNGSFTSASLLASGFSKTGVGQYTLASTTTANAQSAIRMLVFDPTDNQVAPSGTVMTTFSIDVNDGASSTVNFQTDVTVTSVNDAPTLVGGALPASWVNDFNPPGGALSSLLSGSFSDSDVGGSFLGVTVVQNSANPVTEGSWQYSSNGGTNWFAVGTVDDVGNGLAIAANSLVRFVPVFGFTGSPGSLGVRAVDNSYGGGFSTTAGVELRTTIDTSTPTANGFFSNPSGTLSTSVIGNLAPTIGGVDPAQSMNDNATETPFDTVTIGDFENDNVTVVVQLSGGDANGGFTASSLLASGFTKTGVGQYSLASSSPAVAEAAIRALEFDPTENQVAPGAIVATTFTITVDDGGGSDVDGNTTISVSSVNDAPVIANGNLAPSAEDNFSPAGATVTSLLGGSFADADAGSSLGGVVIVANTASSVSEGRWQYSSDGGTTWANIGNVSGTSGLLISESSLIRFVPVLNFFGTPTDLVVRAVDDSFGGAYSDSSGGETRQTLNTSSPVGSSPFASATTTLGTSITGVNDDPTLKNRSKRLNAGTTIVVNSKPFERASADVDGDVLTAVLVLGPSNGTLVLNTDGSFTYTPDDGFVGKDVFYWQAFDGTSLSAVKKMTMKVNPVVILTPAESEKPVESESESESEKSESAPSNPKEEKPALDGTAGKANPTVSGSNVRSAATSNSDQVRRRENDSEIEIPSSVEEETTSRRSSLMSRYMIEEIVVDRSLRIGRIVAEEVIEQALSHIDYALITSAGEMWNELDRLRDSANARVQGDIVMVGAVGAAASSVTVTYVAWAVRSGFFLSGIIAQMPAWQAVDPLMIMQNLGAGSKSETLEQLIERRKRERRLTT